MTRDSERVIKDLDELRNALIVVLGHNGSGINTIGRAIAQVKHLESRIASLETRTPFEAKPLPQSLERLWSEAASATGYLKRQFPDVSDRIWDALQTSMRANGIDPPVERDREP